MTKPHTVQNMMIGLGLLTAWISCPASAVAQSNETERLTSQADLDGDGAISRSEVIQLRERVFERMDRNNDDLINLNDRPQRMGGSRFNSALDNLRTQFDQNGDSQISRNELINAQSPAFDAGDVNGDGILSAKEMNALRREKQR